MAAILAIGCLVEDAEAVRPATYWNSQDGEFFNPLNWNGGLPNNVQDGRIDNGGIARITSPAPAFAQYVYLGSEQNTDGTLEISGAGSANFLSMIVGALNATGNLRILNGGSLTSYGGPIGSDYLGVGVALVQGTGSKWTITGAEMVIGGNSLGTLRIADGGLVRVAGGDGELLMGIHPVSEGNLQIGTGGGAGILQAREIYNGEGRATVYFNHTDPAYVFSTKFTGVKTVNGHLNIEHNGPGTTILTAPVSNLAGTVTVSAGTLIVNGEILGSERDELVDEEEIVSVKTVGTTGVLAGGALGGVGFLEGNVTVAGKLAPGAAGSGLGTLKFGSDLLLDATATVTLELGGTVRGTEFDAVDVAGEMTFDGVLSLSLVGAFEPLLGSTFDLFEGYTTFAGDFTAITFSKAGYAGAFDPGSGVLTITGVPEPGSFALAFTALAGCGLMRRHRRSA